MATGDEVGTGADWDDGDGWFSGGPTSSPTEVSVDDESESEMRRLERAGRTGAEAQCRGRFCPRWRRRRPVQGLREPLVGD